MIWPLASHDVSCRRVLRWVCNGYQLRIEVASGSAYIDISHTLLVYLVQCLGFLHTYHPSTLAVGLWLNQIVAGSVADVQLSSSSINDFMRDVEAFQLYGRPSSPCRTM